MKVGTFLAASKSVLQIEKNTQVHQLVTKCKNTDVVSFLDSQIRVWNNHGQIIPPTTLRNLVVLNGDEYPVQVGFDFSAISELIVLTYEICDEGSLSKTVYVELDLATSSYQYDVELDSIDVFGTTAVKIRNYNLMNIVSPAILPKNSICIFDYRNIVSLQKNNDLMGYAEILTHSNCILREGTLSELHPVVDNSGTPLACQTYSSIAKEYIMGYQGDNVIISTGNDDFLLSPVATGCAVTYCQKSYTKIAANVIQSLRAAGQANNVDKQEFAAAVAAVGKVAERESLPPEQTQFVSNQVISVLPSVKISKLAGLKDFNLASETVKRTGLNKTL